MLDKLCKRLANRLWINFVHDRNFIAITISRPTPALFVYFSKLPRGLTHGGTEMIENIMVYYFEVNLRRER